MSAPTPEPLTPERMVEIRSLDLLALMDDRAGAVVGRALGDLVAEVERLSAEVDTLRNVELVGVNLALYEERQDTGRLRVANRNARERAARWRGNATVLGNAADYAWEQAGELRDELAERPSRAEVLREAANVAGECAEELRGSGGEMAQDREAGAVYVSEQLLRAADDAEAEVNAPTPAPLIVSRFDLAMEPAPEEDPVLTIGCIAEDGRPVALLLDPEARRKVRGWLAPQRKRPPAIPNGVHVVSNGADGWIVKWRKRRNGRHKDFATRPEADAFARRLRATAARLHAERNGGAA